jgi:hypothetical protein
MVLTFLFRHFQCMENLLDPEPTAGAKLAQ